MVSRQQVGERDRPAAVVAIAHDSAQPEAVLAHTPEGRKACAGVDRPDAVERLASGPGFHARRVPVGRSGARAADHPACHCECRRRKRDTQESSRCTRPRHARNPTNDDEKLEISGRRLTLSYDRIILPRAHQYVLCLEQGPGGIAWLVLPSCPIEAPLRVSRQGMRSGMAGARAGHRRTMAGRFAQHRKGANLQRRRPVPAAGRAFSCASACTS